MNEPVDPVIHKHQMFLDSVLSGNVSALTSLFCEDAILMPANEPSLYGRSEVQEWYEDYFQHFRIATISEIERDVAILSDGWIVERYAYMIAIAPHKGGDRIRDDGRFFHLWKREADGEWRISQAMFNSIRPVGSGTQRFVARMSDRRRQQK
jgi:ketosteroid isomerase-like protein